MIVFKWSGLFCGGKRASPESPGGAGAPRSPQVRGLREGRRAAGCRGKAPLRSAPPRCGVPAGAVGGGPPPRGLLGRAGRRRPSPGALLSRKGRGGRGRSATDPGCAVSRDGGTRRPLLLLLLLAESMPPSPRRRVSSSLPLSGASVDGCPAAASWLARSPSASLAHVASRPERGGEGGFRSRLIPSPFFFNGGHRDESRGPPAALSLAGAPSRGPAQRWPPSLLGEGGCRSVTLPPGAPSALQSRSPSSLGGRHLAAVLARGVKGLSRRFGSRGRSSTVRDPHLRPAHGCWASPPCPGAACPLNTTNTPALATRRGSHPLVGIFTGL